MLTEKGWENISSTQVKVKYRSIVPTVLSLLIGDSIAMISNDGMTGTHTTKVKCHEVKEIDEMNETAPESNHKNLNFSKATTYNGLNRNDNFNRVTEDIYMRQDEDGVLSHFCPLNKDRDGVQDKEEEDPPAKTDYEGWIEKGCSLDSDEIPYLMAEPPLKSEDSVIVSNVDSSTSMIYPPVKYRQYIQNEDKELQLLLQDGKPNPSFRKLDDKTLKAWSEASSEEDFYVPRVNDEETLKKYVVGEESDMEEFETTEIENEEPKLVRDEKNQKTVSYEKELFKNDPGDESKKSTKNKFLNENSKDVTVEISEESASNVQTTDENKGASGNETDDTHDKPNGCGKQNGSSQSADEQDLIDLLKSEIENVMFDTVVSLNPSTFKLQETLLKDSTIVRNETDAVKMNKNVASLVLNQAQKNCEPYKEKIRSQKNEENKPNGDSDKTESSDTKMEAEMNVYSTQSKEKQQTLLMEPVAMNLSKPSKTEEEQPDLKTALRFMTEVYHSEDDDGLSFDTLSDMDVPLDIEKPKAVGKSLDEKSVELLANCKSPKKSITFETDITEETKPVTRPRNKITRFFSSFKKKLGKKT